ncbi:MAG: hypothetical protein R2697_05870 [Ilumatobacteraceae bacterium]
MTAIGATAPTHLTIWPGGPMPEASSLNPMPGQPATPNAVTTKLADDGSFSLFNLAGDVDVIVDVNGYFTDTSLDELDQRVSAVESLNAPFSVRLSVGERVALVSNGPISLEADCRTQADNDIEARLLGATTEIDDVILGADEDDFDGGDDDFLFPDTDADDRVIASISASPGHTEVGQDIDSGYVLTASGEYVAIDTETLAIGVNYADSDCIFVGTATSFAANR